MQSHGYLCCGPNGATHSVMIASQFGGHFEKPADKPAAGERQL
jgi:hypothetical protein